MGKINRHWNWLFVPNTHIFCKCSEACKIFFFMFYSLSCMAMRLFHFYPDEGILLFYDYFWNVFFQSRLKIKRLRRFTATLIKKVHLKGFYSSIPFTLRSFMNVACKLMQSKIFQITSNNQPSVRKKSISIKTSSTNIQLIQKFHSQLNAIDISQLEHSLTWPVPSMTSSLPPFFVSINFNWK